MRITLLLSLLFAAISQSANGQNATILTQNMDIGTNQGYVLEFATTQPKLGVDLTLAEIVASDIPSRAERLAARIAAEKPDIVGLQEVGLWRFGFTPQTAIFVLYDQLDLLLRALRAKGVPYRAVAVNSLTDISLPATVGALRLTDRDAMLVRSDSPVQVTAPQNHIFSAYFPFDPFKIIAGWISVEASVNSKPFHLVSTHLMSPIPGVPQSIAVQVAQASELIAALQGDPVPVVLSGDLNSDANGGNGPDATPSAALILSAGYTDVWKSKNPADAGATWPLFLQDQTPPVFFAPSIPFERIDLFYSKGLTIVDAKRVVAPAPLTLPGYASDHTGVIASFRP